MPKNHLFFRPFCDFSNSGNINFIISKYLQIENKSKTRLISIESQPKKTVVVVMVVIGVVVVVVVVHVVVVDPRNLPLKFD